MANLKCPTCGNSFDAARSEAMPFCGERCRMVDLGRWLNEDYGLPVEPDDELSDLGDANFEDGF